MNFKNIVSNDYYNETNYIVDNIQKYIDAGAEKIILGSAAIKDKEFLKKACKKFPNKIAL